jgi:hypothetical protein
MCENANGSSDFLEGFAGTYDMSVPLWWRIDANPSSERNFGAEMRHKTHVPRRRHSEDGATRKIADTIV